MAIEGQRDLRLDEEVQCMRCQKTGGADEFWLDNPLYPKGFMCESCLTQELSRRWAGIIEKKMEGRDVDES